MTKKEIDDYKKNSAVMMFIMRNFYKLSKADQNKLRISIDTLIKHKIKELTKTK